MVVWHGTSESRSMGFNAQEHGVGWACFVCMRCYLLGAGQRWSYVSEQAFLTLLRDKQPSLPYNITQTEHTASYIS